YYLRFCDPWNNQRVIGRKAGRYWMIGPEALDLADDIKGDEAFAAAALIFPEEKRSPGGVDLYVGGTEHAVLHLLYARFWHKVLFDLGYLSKPEPFQRLVNQGVVLGEDNQKLTHATIKKVTEDIESLSFNTAISQMMIFVNAFTNAETLPLSAMRTFLVLLNPFAPHLTSELWQKLNSRFGDNVSDMTEQKWPDYDERFLAEDEVEMVIQVNGKVRDRMKMSIHSTEEDAKSAALANPRIQRLVNGKTVRKVVVVPKKLG